MVFAGFWQVLAGDSADGQTAVVVGSDEGVVSLRGPVLQHLLRRRPGRVGARLLRTPVFQPGMSKYTSFIITILLAKGRKEQFGVG